MSNFDSNITKNPEIFEQNRLAAHSDHECYKHELEKIKGKSSLRYDTVSYTHLDVYKRQVPCIHECNNCSCCIC